MIFADNVQFGNLRDILSDKANNGTTDFDGFGFLYIFAIR